MLSHRLLDTVIVPPYATADRLHVHISVLTAFSMDDEAAALIDSKDGRAIAMTSLVVDELRRDDVHARRNFAAEGERARAKLVENDHNWLEFLAVLDGTFAAPAVVDKVRAVHGLLHRLAGADGRRDRGVLLTLLELEKRACENGFGSDFDGLLGLIKLYSERFGDKAYCFEDLKPYTMLEGSKLLALNAYLDAHTHVSAKGSHITNQDTAPTLCCSINAHKLRRHVLGADELSAAQETEHALAYFRAYTAALELGGALLQNAHDELIQFWLSTFLRIYIPVFLLGSDIDETVEKLLIGDRSKAADIPENKIPLKDCVHQEALLVEVNRQQETLCGNNTKGALKAVATLRSPPRCATHRRMCAILSIGENSCILLYGTAMAARFKEGSGKYRLPWEALHISTLTQEATLMLALASARFKAPAVVKASKFGWLTVSTSEGRCAFIDECRHIQEFVKHPSGNQ
ncbi:hypothetical protein DFH11DRAFT_1550937 [Phellopilus nigrolimitatus]|nr:hypothetical protein DFH11DRAFT_1550937 [Phellopilus nigrolimitatus]